LLMVFAGIGAGMFIVVGIQNASMQKLLKEGEFAEKEKKRTGIREVVGFCYWVVLTAIYLAWSFLTNQWHISWLVYAIGGVLFPIVMCICNLIADKQKKD
ncbi:MAG: XRE family transcriptional regulator, partial [Clostridia bacterium]|nr:XRE family transcriptional regulator [Clostridia bacterium]